uniref:Uncharacterized protein n=1 Tax=Oryza glumipatula TaxID=40148 RepID=A0A0E0AJD9_9ORYZ
MNSSDCYCRPKYIDYTLITPYGSLSFLQPNRNLCIASFWSSIITLVLHLQHHMDQFNMPCPKKVVHDKKVSKITLFRGTRILFNYNGDIRFSYSVGFLMAVYTSSFRL